MSKKKEITVEQQENKDKILLDNSSMIEEEIVDVMDELTNELGEIDSQQPNDKIFFTEPLLVTQDVVNSIVTSKEFQEGIKLASKSCGLYTTLINFGIEESVASEMVMIEFANDYTIKHQKVVNEAVKAQANLVKGSQL